MTQNNHVNNRGFLPKKNPSTHAEHSVRNFGVCL